jgi:hypothetical protein
VNILCDFVLLTAFIEETTTVDTAMLNDIVKDLDFNRLYWGSKKSMIKDKITPAALMDALDTPEP